MRNFNTTETGRSINRPGDFLITAFFAIALSLMLCLPATAQASQEVLDSISTPNQVKTSIGTLEFLDGAPYPETAEKVYDYIDSMRGVDALLKGMPGASLQGLIKGARSQGAIEAHQVLWFDQLMDSQSLYLTGNTSSLYVLPNLDLKRDGPTVLEAPAGMLGAFNDAWFRYVRDIGPAGPDKGQGGKYLVLPPGYEGEVPKGYFVVKPRTYDVWVFMRASIAEGLDAAAKNVSKTYRLRLPPNPPAKDFWALTMYDNQTRSQLQTVQRFPTVGSQTEGIRRNEDGSYDIYFGPEAPAGYENNWLATVPGKGWFVALRMYGPLEPWIEKTRLPGEIELVE